MGTYRTAQVCPNGHVSTSSLETFREGAEKFCSTCGEETIHQCPKCQIGIRGEYYVEGVVDLVSRYSPPGFCHNCGAPFPWTQAKIDAAKELADEFDDLSSEEREELKGTIDDLVSDTPRTEVAAFRYKKIAKKLGAGAAGALRSIVVDVASEAAKKVLFGD